MNGPPRFQDSVYDRIGTYLPLDQREMYYRYVAHLRTLAPDDSLLVLAEGMAVFACISRQVPEALTNEREKLLAEFTQLCRKHETTTANATTDTRAMFAAHQKLLEQSIGTWQSREQQSGLALERIAANFEKTVALPIARLQTTVTEIDTATKEHRANAGRVHHLLQLANWQQMVWPCVGSALGGGLLVAAVVYFRSH
jgi:hypothetical protein